MKTPLITNRALDAAAGAKVFVKEPSACSALARSSSARSLQPHLPADARGAGARRRGLLLARAARAQSRVAATAALMGTPAVIVMPAECAEGQDRGHEGAGGYEVITYDRWTQESREEIGAQDRQGTRLDPRAAVRQLPRDRRGRGRLGLEAALQLQALGETADVALAPASEAAGWSPGSAFAFGALSPSTRIFAVEPEALRRPRPGASKAGPSGRRRADTEDSPARRPAEPEQPGELTFALNRRQLSGAVGVSDAEAMAAVAFAFRHLKLVLEPGGAAALAAVLAGKVETAGRTVLVVALGRKRRRGGLRGGDQLGVRDTASRVQLQAVLASGSRSRSG